MKRDKEFNDILDECLECLLVKGEMIEQCLERYPEYAVELEPLLKTAVAANEALAIQPDPEFKARVRYQLSSSSEGVKPRKRVSPFTWQPRWAMAVMIVLAVLIAGGGTVVAADNSMPDNPLYPVKLATEQVRVTLTPSDIGKAEIYAAMVDRRVTEIDYMVERGKPQRVELLAQRLRTHLEKLNSLPLAQIVKEPARAPELKEEAGMEGEKMGNKYGRGQENRQARFRNILGRYAEKHPARLRALLEQVPESVKPALQRAINLSVASYEKVLEDTD